jgi:hypothetical protein
MKNTVLEGFDGFWTQDGVSAILTPAPDDLLHR